MPSQTPIADVTLSSCMQSRPTRRSALQLGAALLAVAASPWSHAAAGELQELVWTDSAHNRSIPALLRWPAQGSKPQGVVIFSHGLGGKRSGADAWGSAWAQAGFLVVHLQHPGSDAQAVRDAGLTGLRKVMAPEQVLARVIDVRFAIDELQRLQTAGQGRWADVPLQRLAVAGHSMGARTVQALAGQNYAKVGNLADKRIKAFIALSPALGKGATPAQAQTDARAMTRPMLVVSGSLDGEVLGNGETVDTRRKVYDVLPAGAKALLWLQGADHMTFAGQSETIKSSFLLRREDATIASDTTHHNTVAAVTTAWLKEQLLAQPMTAPVLSAQDVWLRG
jgi:predicted dienelactone hydrolase